mmetsp:Transcript_21832/g.45887  ORF Transcript_21832/g.45887 Transcript_21832/m.45887 type:complete len:86 (+) Transcript_21832:1444-1701(+)
MKSLDGPCRKDADKSAAITAEQHVRDIAAISIGVRSIGGTAADMALDDMIEDTEEDIQKDHRLDRKDDITRLAGTIISFPALLFV